MLGGEERKLNLIKFNLPNFSALLGGEERKFNYIKLNLPNFSALLGGEGRTTLERRNSQVWPQASSSIEPSPHS